MDKSNNALATASLLQSLPSTEPGLTHLSTFEHRRENPSDIDSIQVHLDRLSDELLSTLPIPEQLSAAGRRGIIARYSSVLEGNFIYWMTGAYLAVKSEEARSIILENLHEEVRDSHPLMLRKFTMAAHACPNDSDALAVNPNLTKVRLFIGRLSPTRIVAMMAFFERFIQKFMPYLAELAARQGSQEQEYTDVHGVCDIAHSQELFRALTAEMPFAQDSPEPAAHLYEGVYLLEELIQSIVCDAPGQRLSLSETTTNVN